ncbi:MAG: hypothetical protein KJ698_01265 [Actinobacteria bacterium]|nr:hypothetical protein [Actinomycetota bacterium]MBU1493575.1 hypothetical protein [Actinomycetota bacterium]MBU1866559.1 hypothetical protein [Actinomycetota bacterium]
MAGLRDATADLAASLDDLAEAVRSASSFGELWAAEAPVADRLLRMQADLFGASRLIERYLKDSGATLTGGVWQVPDSSPPLAALAAAWESVIPFQFETLGPLLGSRNAGDAEAIVDSGAWCAPSAALAGAVDLLVTDGEG